MSYLPSIRERIISAVFYTAFFFLPMALGPLICLLIVNLRRIYIKDFFKYHCYQAMLFNMIIFLLPQIFSLLVEFLITILNLLVIFANSAGLLADFKNFILQTYEILIAVVVIYAIVWTARGKFTYLPPISQAVNLLLR